MAQRTEVTVFDDIDGSTEGVTPVRFSWGGTDYEIDLSPGNRAIAEERFGDFISHARRAGRAASNGHAAAPRRRRDRGNSGAIRAWAAEQGITVSERGRIPVTVIAQYEASR